MSDVKHTVLPWSYEGGCVRSKSGIVARRDGDSYHIPPTERDANMRYIVTACNAYPALVEALQTLLEFAHGALLSDEPDEDLERVESMARAALAQAQGDE